MSVIPFISICIPAYKNSQYVQRLLDSVAMQTFRDFEVIITDDSPDNKIAELVKQYQPSFAVKYFKHQQPAGSPANWNKAISRATGEWIKIMHDDDWFADSDSLDQFVKVAKETACNFIFSGFTNVNLNTGAGNTFIISKFQEAMLRRNPLYLFRTNYIGHPSTTLIRNNQAEWFDVTVKWVVDFEFYIRMLRKKQKFSTIRKPLINIGIGDEQITTEVFRKKEVEIPENLYLLQKIGINSLHYIFVYDYYWRLMRNLKISSSEELKQYVNSNSIPPVIYSITRFQQKLGLGLLKRFGTYSKFWMSLHYIWYRIKYA